MAKGLTDDDLRIFSDSSPTPRADPAADATDAARIERAKDIAAKNRCKFLPPPRLSSARTRSRASPGSARSIC